MKQKKRNLTLDRKIYFYKVICEVSGVTKPLSDVFDDYQKHLGGNLQNLVERGFATENFDKYLFLELEKHLTDQNIYNGIFYNLRISEFPFLFDLNDGARSEITQKESDALMEMTHFSYFANDDLIVSEYNYYGAKIEYLGRHLQNVFQNIYPSLQYDISVVPVVIPEYYENIKNCKWLYGIQFKVATPGKRLLAEKGVIGVNDVIGESLGSIDCYIDINVSGIQGRSIDMKEPNVWLSNAIDAIKEAMKTNNLDKDEKPIFRKAKVKGYNVVENKTIPYDLLEGKLVSTCKVEKISPKTKYVNKNEMFNKILEAYIEKKDDALKYMGT